MCIFVIEFCCSYYKLCDLGWGYLTHQVTWLINHMITWYAKKKALSPPSLGEWPPILARCDLSRVYHNHRVTWLIYDVITLYLQKGASPISQRQWPLNLVGLWVRVKGPHLLFQVTCWSSYYVLLWFVRSVMYPLTQGHKTQFEISNIEKLKNQKLFWLFKRY